MSVPPCTGRCAYLPKHGSVLFQWRVSREDIIDQWLVALAIHEYLMPVGSMPILQSQNVTGSICRNTAADRRGVRILEKLGPLGPQFPLKIGSYGHVGD